MPHVERFSQINLERRNIWRAKRERCKKNRTADSSSRIRTMACETRRHTRPSRGTSFNFSKCCSVSRDGCRNRSYLTWWPQCRIQPGGRADAISS
jgi:hypothetical protein